MEIFGSWLVDIVRCFEHIISAAMKLLLAVRLALLLATAVCLDHRSKRVINGVPFNGRPYTYEVIRYYGSMATAHVNVNPWLVLGLWNLLKDWGVFGHFVCSGSIISPAIFQTACHCVADFNIGSDRTFHPPKVMNHWEGMKVVYLGVSNRFGENSMASTKYVLTERFIVHSKCGEWRGNNATLIYDYAIIQIDSDFIHTTYPWDEIRWAPQYTSLEITDFHHYALKNQLTCMYIGFGIYKRGNPQASDVLRHGWRELMEIRDCVKYTVPFLRMDNWVSLFNWVCTSSVPKYLQDGGSGDSGSPVTCNNRYFAMHNQGIIVGGLYIGMDHALVHDLYINSVNYRRALINRIYRFGQTYGEDTFPKTLRFMDRSEGNERQTPTLLSRPVDW